MANTSLSRARAAKNDEFYTLLSSVENELRFYDDALYGKTILCNCNDGENSAFHRYFSANYQRLNLKRLIYIKYGASAYKLEIIKDKGIVRTYLQGSGDFRSDECIDILKTADIVITNPPFSLFREFLDLLYSNQKQFLIVGNLNMVVCQSVFSYFSAGKLHFGYTAVKSFSQPDSSLCSFGNTYWYSNINIPKQNQHIPLHSQYSPDKYPFYDNYPAVEVGRVTEIPNDYYGLMGVPITYLLRHDPKQFEIIGLAAGHDELAKPYINPIQHRQDGTTIRGSKVNDTAVISVREKPIGIYYTADNSDGYLICRYKRVLIKRKT